MDTGVKFKFFGYGPDRVYPGTPHPNGGVLAVSEGEIVDFGESLPPNDGLWYAIGDDGAPVHYVAEPPAVPKLGTAS